MNKRKHFVKHDKAKPADVKSNKKGETRHICLDLLYAKSTTTTKILLHVKSDNKWMECLKILLHAKSDINIITMMKNSATASSNSPCPGSLESNDPK